MLSERRGHIFPETHESRARREGIQRAIFPGAFFSAERMGIQPPAQAFQPAGFVSAIVFEAKQHPSRLRRDGWKAVSWNFSRDIARAWLSTDRWSCPRRVLTG